MCAGCEQRSGFIDRRGRIPGFLSIFPTSGRLLHWHGHCIGYSVHRTLLFGRYQLSKQSRRTTEGNPAGSDAAEQAVPAALNGSFQSESFDSSESANSPTTKAAQEAVVDIMAPIKGKVVPLSEVPDPAFADKQMGQGIAILPSEGKVYAPLTDKSRI